MAKEWVKSVLSEKKYTILVILILCLCFCFFIFYIIVKNDTGAVHKNFIEAESLYAKKEYDSAVVKYNEYLSDEKVYDEKKRWLVWQRLLYITVQLKSDFMGGITILKSMEKEYEYDRRYMPHILKDMIQVYHMKRAKEDVMTTLEKLLSNDYEIASEEKVKLYRQYATLIGEDIKYFERGKQQLGICIQKEEESVVQWCQYELGVIYTLNEQYKKAQPIFNALLDKSNPTDEIHYSSRFMLATLYGFVGEKEQAIEELEAIRDIYPNKEVIDSRIKALRKRGKNDF